MTTGCVTDAQFVQDAILELRRSRHALMSSYAYGYYIERHMERELFEELQVIIVSPEVIWGICTLTLILDHTPL